MKFLFLSIALFALFTACELTPSKPESVDALTIIAQTKYQFQQPLALRENLLSERGFNALDSLQWQKLGLNQSIDYNSSASYYILGKLAPINELFSSLLLLEDHPSYSRSWLITYNTLGRKIDQLLVFHQRHPSPLRQSAYLKDNQVELTLEGSIKKRYQLTEAGTFLLVSN